MSEVPSSAVSERSPGEAVRESTSTGGESSAGEQRPGFFRRHWRGLLSGVAVVLVLVGIGVVVAINWEAEPVFEGVEAPRYDSSLAAGGLSSDQIGAGAVLSSLEKTQPPGYEILADASDEGVIDQFAETPASGQWDSVYQLNDGDYVFRFDADDSDGDEFTLVTKASGSQSTAHELFAVARRYGFYGPKALSEDRALDDRVAALQQTFDDRQFFAGETEPDIAAEAAALADEWNRWLAIYGEYPPKARVVELTIELLNELEAVASSGSRGFDHYYDLIDEVNDAQRAYNRSLE